MLASIGTITRKQTDGSGVNIITDNIDKYDNTSDGSDKVTKYFEFI